MKYFIVFTLLFSYVEFSSAQDTNRVQNAEPILAFSDVDPEFPGGEEAMAKFLQSNIMYPEEAIELGEQGTVYVQFVINTDGSISDVTILKGVSTLLDAEAMRVINLMPNWNPGVHNGKPVRVRYIVPISFKITNAKSKKRK